MKTAQEMLGEIKQLCGNHKLERECPSCGEVQPLVIDHFYMGFKCDHCGYREEVTKTRELLRGPNKVEETFERYKNWNWDPRS